MTSILSVPGASHPDRTRLHAPQSRDCKALLQKITQRVDLSEDALRATVELKPTLMALTRRAGRTSNRSRTARRSPWCGAELRLILQGAGGDATKPDPNVIRAVLDAGLWLATYLSRKPGLTFSLIAKAEGADMGDVLRSLQLAVLAPGLVRLILDGRRSPDLTATKLKRLDRLPLLWDHQKAVLG